MNDADGGTLDMFSRQKLFRTSGLSPSLTVIFMTENSK